MRDAATATRHVATVTGSTFEADVVNGRGRIVVEFMSYGCTHCRTLEPILQRVAAELAANTRIFHLNVALEEDLATRYDIQATPTLLMFLDGRELGRAVGPHPTVASITAEIAQPFTAAGWAH